MKILITLLLALFISGQAYAQSGGEKFVVYYPLFIYNNMDMHKAGENPMMISPTQKDETDGTHYNYAFNSRGECEDYLVSEQGINTFPKIPLYVRLNKANHKVLYHTNDYVNVLGYCATLTLNLSR